MLIVSHVCAEFHDAKGEILFAVTPAIRNTFIEAPESIRQDPLFHLLVAEGSLEAAFTKERKTALEHNPESGLDGTGKLMYPAEIKPEPASEADPAQKSAKSGKASKSAKADPEPKQEEAAPDPVPEPATN